MIAQGTALSRSALAGLCILVVDDNDDARALLRSVLEFYGATVLTAGSASQALETLELIVPDLLVSDIGMPDEDGYILLRTIRAFEPERGGQIPAVACTGFPREYDRTRLREAGFQAHLTKPIQPVQLMAAITPLVGR